MKRITLKNSRGLTLVGNYYSAPGKCVVIMCHGFTGDKSEWGRFDKIAQSLQSHGFNIIAFDFSGCGESDDDSLTVDKQVDDLECVIRYAEMRGMKNIGLYGHSLGGLISAKGYTKKIKCVVWTAPVTQPKTNYGEKKFTKEQQEELLSKGYITKIRKRGVRKRFIIDKQMIKDREDVDPKKLLPRIKSPVLIIHGDEDDTLPVSDSIDAVKYLPSYKLEIIKGEDHDFAKKLDVVIKLTVNWFEKWLNRK